MKTSVRVEVGGKYKSKKLSETQIWFLKELFKCREAGMYCDCAEARVTGVRTMRILRELGLMTSGSHRYHLTQAGLNLFAEEIRGKDV